MPPAGSSSNGGRPAGQLARVREAGSRLESADARGAERRREATIEGLTVALGRLRRGAAALKAENHQLRADVAEARRAASDGRRREGVLRDAGKLAEIAVPAGARAPRAARIVIAHCLAGLVAPRILRDAQLLATELVTNSVRHAELDDRDGVIVRVYIAADVLRLEIENPGIAGVVASQDPNTEAGQGFGLHLLDRLAARWGTSRDHSTNVWFEMARA
jgi:hypothetical protein